MSTIPQLATLKTRLGQLNLQKARYGISADPHIEMEASDLSTVVGQMDLIEINRRNLDHLIRQRDTFSGQPPVHILNQINSTRAEVARLRQVCAQLGQNVPEHPVDSDKQPELPPIQPRTTPADFQNKVDIRAKLDQIQQLINDIRNAL